MEPLIVAFGIGLAATYSMARTDDLPRAGAAVLAVKVLAGIALYYVVLVLILG